MTADSSNRKILFISDKDESGGLIQSIHVNCKCLYCVSGHKNNITDHRMYFPQTIDNWILATNPPGYRDAIVTIIGTMKLTPTENVHVEMSVDKAILMTHIKQGTSVGVNNNKSVVSLYHPMGCVTYKNGCIDIRICVKEKGNRVFKLRANSIEFATNDGTFLVNEKNFKRTTVKKLNPTCVDPVNVFYDGSRHGSFLIQKCMKLFDASDDHLSTSKCVTTRLINQVKIETITQETVHVHCGAVKLNLTENGVCHINAPNFSCCASAGTKNHLFVKYGLSRLHSDGKTLMIKCSNRKIVCDENGVVEKFCLFDPAKK